MNQTLKYGLIAAGLGLGIYSLMKSDDETTAASNALPSSPKQPEPDEWQEELEAIKTELAAMQQAQPAVQTSNNFVAIPMLQYEKLGLQPGDTVEFRKYLLDYIIANYPQQCNFVGFYRPNFTYSFRGYKYPSTSNYIVVHLDGIGNAQPGNSTFGYYNGEYFQK